MYQKKMESSSEDTTFELLDTNGDGEIERNEYITFYKSRSNNADNVEQELEKYFTALDRNQDGKISETELKNYRQSNAGAINSQVFEFMDMDNDGKVSSAEFNAFLSIGEKILNSGK